MEAENLVLRCMTCKKDFEATTSMYSGLIRKEEHQGHKIRFVDKTTGDVVAKTAQEAVRMGLIERKVETGEEGLDFTHEGDALIPLKISLPASALTLFFYAKRNGISDHANVIDFLWEYAQKGFMEAHNLGLTLAPVKAAPGDGSGVERAVVALSEKFDKFVEQQAAGGKEKTKPEPESKAEKPKSKKKAEATKEV